jgi:beta-lactamase superfamily II metal-dependent hydrolase
MGDEKYGDAIVVVAGGRKILIDGAHIRDFEQRFEAPSIPDQLRNVLGAEPPFRFDLLVVTHCHGDHIGCLPTLVADKIVEADWALVADEDLGYPAPDDSGADDAPDPIVDTVVAALREEPRTDFASDAELDAFLTDAMKLEPSYRAMVQSLEDSGTHVIRFVGVDDDGTLADLQVLTQEFSDFDLRILGPTQRHLLLCTDAIAEFTRAAKKAAKRKRQTDATADAGRIYRELAGGRRAADTALPDDISQFLDRPGKGAALNDQSIVLKLGADENAVLLTGDMQFAAAEIAEVDQLMAALLRTVVDAGPYAVVKLAHHGSYNGFDDKVLEGFRDTQVFAVTTGRGDPGHPHEDVLALLRSVRGQSHWVRTDRNGLVTLDVRNGRVEITKSRGRIDDAAVHREDVALPSRTEMQSAAVEQPREGAATVTQRITPAASEELVEVTARIPHLSTRVTITVEVEPGAPSPRLGQRDRVPVGSGRSEARNQQPETLPPLAAGRKLPPLLFVTNRARLEKNIGANELQQATRIIESSHQPLVDIARPDNPFPELRAAIGKYDPAGVVLLGGYDVLRAIRYDTIPKDVRDRLGDNADPDDFVVWSDQAYGDRDGDTLGELPVSRIPDGRSGELLKAALCTCSANPRAQRFGVRNHARPFADDVFNNVDGTQAIMVSHPTRSRGLDPAAVDASSIYIMLHGSDTDATRFWGELITGGTIEAVYVGNIPNPCGGTVLAGCCWGALTVRTPALRYSPGDPVQSLTPEQSIALSFLQRGARAFVGCTGAHYSPVDDNPAAPLDHFGAPMHAAFWSHLLKGKKSPAQALFDAKMDYIRDMPHGCSSSEELAIEYKILREFTCLGLGW